jgi:hypothetical protein
MVPSLRVLAADAALLVATAVSSMASTTASILARYLKEADEVRRMR